MSQSQAVAALINIFRREKQAVMVGFDVGMSLALLLPVALSVCLGAGQPGEMGSEL